MKKLIFIVFFLIGLGTTAYGDFFAPNYKKSSILTVNSSVVNMSLDDKWAVYPGATTTCIFRILSTSTKNKINAGVKHVAPANTTTIRKINPIKSKYVNFSGCTGADLARE